MANLRKHMSNLKSAGQSLIFWQKNQRTITPVYSWERELGLTSINRQLLLQAYQKRQSTNTSSNSGFAYMCFKDYCHHTSLHGYKYITEDSNCNFERILWIIFCVCATIGMALYLRPVFERYMETPISTSIDSVSEPIWNAPFPGVTICNVNKAIKSVVDNLPNTARWGEYEGVVSKDLIRYLAKMGHVQTNRVKLNIDAEQFDAVVEKEVKTEGLAQIMKDVMQPINRLALRCWWVSRPVQCSKLFELKHTDEGYCWGFNSVSITLEDEKSHDNFQPESVNGAGPDMGLTVLLNPDAEEYYSYISNIHGFKVRIHHPMNFPNIATKAFLLEAGREVSVAVTPTATKSSKNIRETPMSKRQCRFGDEMKLNYFPTFSYDNCRMECVLATMRNTCRCVAYMYLNLKNQTPCNYKGLECINDHTSKFLTLAPKSPVEGLKPMDSMENCPCPPSCTELTYSYEMSKATFPKFPDDLNYLDESINRTNLVLLHVFFKMEAYVQYKRDVMFTGNDFIAYFGGIVSLFIGFSFISIFEIIYFCTVKPFLRWKRQVPRRSLY